MAGNPGTPGLKASSKTAAILLALTTGGEHTRSAFAAHTHLPASAVYQLLHDLASSPVVERTADGRYQPAALRGLALTPEPPTLDTRGPVNYVPFRSKMISKNLGQWLRSGHDSRKGF
jgi:hypothetical protein